ncbi:MAG TPA: hypothetical protein VEL31_25790 [Ktedonobacteraceae bacterium]|nr:hypothetical protein [Ktedonobacteraceae bacterium]
MYDIGEGVFVLIALSSLVSPFSKQNWVLTMISCFFIVLLAGTDLANTRSEGLISIALRLFVPGIIGALQRFAVFVLRLLTYLFCILLAAVIGLNLYLQAQHIFHTQSLNIFVIIVILLLALGVLILNFMFLWKVITFPIKKLIEWMEIEIVDPSGAM